MCSDSAAARASERSTGMVPKERNHERMKAPLTPVPWKYSALPRKLTRRPEASGMTIESLNERWLLAMIAGLPTLLVYVIAGKYFVRGLTAGAVKG